MSASHYNVIQRAEQIQIRDAFQAELCIHGYHHKLSVRRLLTSAGKFGGFAKRVRNVGPYCSKTKTKNWYAINFLDACNSVYFRYQSECEAYLTHSAPCFRI